MDKEKYYWVMCSNKDGIHPVHCYRTEKAAQSSCDKWSGGEFTVWPSWFGPEEQKQALDEFRTHQFQEVS